MNKLPNQPTSNYEKHTSKNPLKKIFIWYFFHVLLNNVKDLEIDKVMDAGCGEGFVLNKLKENNIGKAHEGIDFSKEAIAIGKKTYPSLNLKEGDIYKFAYKSNSFDLVVCSEVLEHLEYPDKALKEIVRVSKKYILLSVPNEPWFIFFNYTRWGQNIGHINKWSSSSFQKFITNHSSLKILQVKHPFPWTMLLVQKLT